MANCSSNCGSICPLPADLQAAMDHAVTCKSFIFDGGTAQTFNIEECCRAMMSALDSDSVISIDLDDVRSLLNQGRISAGHDRTLIGEGAVIKACKTSIQGSLIESPDLLRTATGILVIIQTPQNSAIKLSEVRNGLREIWQHCPDSAQCIYACIHGDSAVDAIEVYTLVANNANPNASDPQLAFNQGLSLDQALQKLSHLAEQTDSDLVLLQNACRLLAKHQKSSASFIQRKLKIGYSRASELLNQLEREGIVGSLSSDGHRSVLVRF